MPAPSPLTRPQKGCAAWPALCSPELGLCGSKGHGGLGLLPGMVGPLIPASEDEPPEGLMGRAGRALSVSAASGLH